MGTFLQMASPGYNMRLVLVLLLVGQLAHGQERIGTTTGLYGTQIDTANRVHYQFMADRLITIHLETLKSDTIPVPGLGAMIRDYYPVFLKTKVLLVHRNGGLVYQVDSMNLRRIDRSYEHRMQAGSLIFVRNDTLFRHGGYGFWSARRELIYFNFSSAEWELYKLSKNTQEPPALFAHTGSLEGSKLTVFLGMTIEPREPLNVRQLPAIWQLDFKEKKWTYLGDINLDNYNGFYSSNIFHSNKDLYSFSHEINSLKLDLKNNEIIRYQGTPLYLQILRSETVRPYALGNYLYFYRATRLHQDNTKVEDLDLEFCRIPMNDFLIKQISTMPLKKEKWSSTAIAYLVIGSLAIIALIAGAKHWSGKNRKTKLKIQDNLLVTGNRTHRLSSVEFAIIQLLLESNTDVTTNQILDLTSTPGQDHTHNLRQKNQIIDNLNQVMADMLEISEDLIYTERLQSDKRIKRYLIRKEYFTT